MQQSERSPHGVVRLRDEALRGGRVVRVWADTPLNNMYVVIYIYSLLKTCDSCPTETLDRRLCTLYALALSHHTMPPIIAVSFISIQHL